MKKITLLLVLLLFAVTGIWAHTPNEFKYQAILRNADGTIMAQESVQADISILQGSATGTSVFDETHNITTTAQGLINLNIGSQADMSVVDWSADIYFIGISVNSTVMGTSQLLSVPYAMHAKTAESIAGSHYIGEHGLICSLVDIDGGSGVAWSNIDNVEIGTTAKSDFNGVPNTIAIIGQNGHISSAAKLCVDYSTTGTSAGD